MIQSQNCMYSIYNGIEMVFVINCYIIESCLWQGNNFEIKNENFYLSCNFLLTKGFLKTAFAYAERIV